MATAELREQIEMAKEAGLEGEGLFAFLRDMSERDSVNVRKRSVNVRKRRLIDAMN